MTVTCAAISVNSSYLRGRGIFPSQNPNPPENHPKHSKIQKYIKFTPSPEHRV